MRAKRATFTFKNGQKLIKMPKILLWSNRQDRSILIRQKLVENVKIGNLKCYILGDFQTT